MSRPDHPRIACLVDGCGRGTKRIAPIGPDRVWLDHDGRAPQWICGKHWRPVPRQMKARHRKLARLYYRNWPEGTDAPIDARRERRLFKLVRLSWARLRAEAESAGRGEITGASVGAFLEKL